MLPLKDSQSPGIFPFWVVLIIVFNILAFFLELTALDPDSFITTYAFIPNYFDFFNLQSWIPLITSQFLHGGFVHLISNMLFLWVFGDNVEDQLEFVLFPIFYLFCGIIAGLTQYFVDPTSQIPMIGASGAVAGVLGAYFASFPSHKIKTLVPFFGFLTVVELPASFMLLYWFMTQFFSGVASISTIAEGGVAYFAHIGGFAIGWILGKVTSRSRSLLQVEP